MDRYYSGRELAEKLGLSWQTIRLWTMRGQIPHVKFERRVLFSESDIEAWLEGKKKEAKTEKQKK